MRFRFLIRAALVASCLVTPRALAEEPAADRAALLAAKLQAIEALQKEVDQLRRELGKSQPVPAAPPAVLEDTESVINISTVVVEANLTKLRALGHEVKSEKELFELLGFHHNKGPFATIEDHEATEKQIRPLLEQKTVTILSSPELITRDGQEATIAIGESAGPECALPGLHVKLTPRKVGDEFRIEFEGTLKCRKPVPADAPPGYAKNPIALSKVQTTLGAKPGQAVVVHGGNLERATTITENGVEKTIAEEIVPLYILTANVPKQAKVGAAAPAPQPAVPLAAIPYPAHPVILSKPTKVTSELARDAVDFQTFIYELNLTKLRNRGIDVRSADHLQVALGMIDPKTIAEEAPAESELPPYVVLPKKNNLDATLKNLIEQGAAVVFNHPSVRTEVGESAIVQCPSTHVTQHVRAVPISALMFPNPYAWNEKAPTPRNVEQLAALETGRFSQGHELRFLPRVLSSEALTFDFCAEFADSQNNTQPPQARSEVSRTINLPRGRSVAIFGLRSERHVKKEQDGRTSTIVEEILPLYVVKAKVISSEVEAEQTAQRPNDTR